MGRTAAERIAQLPAERQERIRARAQELIAEELTWRPHAPKALRQRQERRE